MFSRFYFVVVVTNSLLRECLLDLTFVLLANSLLSEDSIVVANAISTFVLLVNSFQKTCLRSRARYERNENFIVMSSVLH